MNLTLERLIEILERPGVISPPTKHFRQLIFADAFLEELKKELTIKVPESFKIEIDFDGIKRDFVLYSNKIPIESIAALLKINKDDYDFNALEGCERIDDTFHLSSFSRMYIMSII